MHFGNEPLLKEIREIWSQALIVNRPGRELDQLGADFEDGMADVVTVGTWLISNPDFVERVKVCAPLNQTDRNTMYAGGAKGYIDYPFIEK